MKQLWKAAASDRRPFVAWCLLVGVGLVAVAILQSCGSGLRL